MGKPAIKPFNLRDIALTGEFIITPGSNDLSFRVGSNTAFLDMKEVYQLVRTLDHHSTKVWGDKWIDLFKETE